MREIKFRVWNGIRMEFDVMVGKFGIFYINPGNDQDGLDENDHASLSQFNTKYSDSVKVMQYTGLHDKNGKEIYEGDIVNVYISGMHFITIVQWGDRSHGWSLKCDRKNKEKFGTIKYYSLPISSKIEIIGNIYENQELLKEHK